MLRVSKVDEWLNRAPTPPDLAAPSDSVVVIRSGQNYDGKQGMSLATGISARSAGSQALCLHVILIPPGTRGVPHVHANHESAIYTVSGETEVWHGEGLRQRTVVTAGDFMYIPPGTPHLPVNRSDVMTFAVVARTDPQEQESVHVIGLPEHLDELRAFPIASQELPPRPDWRPTGKVAGGGTGNGVRRPLFPFLPRPRAVLARGSQPSNASGGGQAQTRFLSP